MRFFSRWRLVRLAIGALLLFSAVAAYLYVWSRPSYALYADLLRDESTQSLKHLDVAEPFRKYVMFRQLQGAGFNNQVRASTATPLIVADKLYRRKRYYYTTI